MSSNAFSMDSATEVSSINSSVAAGMTPGLLGIFTLVIVIYYYIFYSVGIKSGEMKVYNKSFGTMFLEIILWGLFLFLLGINTLQYYYDINIVTEIKNFFSDDPKVNITVKQPVEEEETPDITKVQIQPQVFHLRGNKYDYENAKAVCKAYGSRLANYDDMQKALKDGAEWCSYGWSEGQAALFPTQKETWDKLQKIKGHENDCGRPGLNGGYIANPNVRFGVNCFGYKPNPNASSQKLMESETVYPKSAKELAFEERVKKWRKEVKNLTISPFNGERWSII